MPALNEDFESLEYESTSVIINSEEIFSTIMLGVCTWIIIFGAKAILFTLRATNIEEAERELRELERQESNIVSDFRDTPVVKKKSKTKKKIDKWAKSKCVSFICLDKVRSLSYEYKYNFFIRLFLEAYLEACMLSILNIYYYKFDTIFQWVSFGAAFIFLVFMHIWLVVFLKRYPSRILKKGPEGLKDPHIGKS